MGALKGFYLPRPRRHWTPQYIKDRVQLRRWERRHPEAPWLVGEAVDLLTTWLRPATWWSNLVPEEARSGSPSVRGRSSASSTMWHGPNASQGGCRRSSSLTSFITAFRSCGIGRCASRCGRVCSRGGGVSPGCRRPGPGRWNLPGLLRALVTRASAEGRDHRRGQREPISSACHSIAGILGANVPPDLRLA